MPDVDGLTKLDCSPEGCRYYLINDQVGQTHTQRRVAHWRSMYEPCKENSIQIDKRHTLVEVDIRTAGLWAIRSDGHERMLANWIRFDFIIMEIDIAMIRIGGIDFSISHSVECMAFSCSSLLYDIALDQG